MQTTLLLDLLIAGLAGWQAVEAWHHGSLFASLRERLGAVKRNSQSALVQKLCELLLCPFCLSHWVCLMCVVVLRTTDPASLGRLPLYAFAATRIAQVLNDLTHGFSRSPSSLEEVEVDQSEEVGRFELTDGDPPSDV